jgi:hypothetical protein
VIVLRGPSLASCSAAIVAAIEADAVASGRPADAAAALMAVLRSEE